MGGANRYMTDKNVRISSRAGSVAVAHRISWPTPRRCAGTGCVIRFIRVEFHRSASKHGIDADDVLHAVAHALVVADMGDNDSPLRTLVLGPDRAGNMIEVIVLHFHDGREMAIHAMPMRSRYIGLLPRPQET